MESKKGCGKRLSDSKRVDIVRKLQRPHAPSKRAIARDYDISEGAIRKLWNQRDAIISSTEDRQENTRASAFRMRQTRFPELLRAIVPMD
jgi:hypothetical protein